MVVAPRTLLWKVPKTSTWIPAEMCGNAVSYDEESVLDLCITPLRSFTAAVKLDLYSPLDVGLQCSSS